MFLQHLSHTAQNRRQLVHLHVTFALRVERPQRRHDLVVRICRRGMLVENFEESREVDYGF